MLSLIRRRDISLEREKDLRIMTGENDLMTKGQKSMIGMTEVITGKEDVNMIGTVGNMIGMIEIGAIIVIVTWICLNLAIMILEADEDLLPVPPNVIEILSDRGAMINAEASAHCRKSDE